MFPAILGMELKLVQLVHLSSDTYFVSDLLDCPLRLSL